MKIFYKYFLVLISLILLNGCGVPQEEHDAIVIQLQSELADFKTDTEQRISELESIVKSEKAKVKSHRLEMDNAERKLKDLQQKNADLVRDIAKAKSEIVSLKREIERSDSAKERAQAATSKAEEQLAEVVLERDDLKFRFDQLINNLNGTEEVIEDDINNLEQAFLDEFSDISIELNTVQSNEEPADLIANIVEEMNSSSTSITKATPAIESIKQAALNEKPLDSKSNDNDSSESRSFFWFLGF